jgi:glutathione S-transferase
MLKHLLLLAIATLYYLPYCPYSRQVLTHLEHAPHPLIMKDLSIDVEAREELLHKGGEARVPCLITNKQAIYGAQAVIDWLETH